LSYFCVIDFETRSRSDLKKAGAWHYAEDPSTDILCLGYSINGAPARVLTDYSLCDLPDDLWVAIHEATCFFIAHNVGFEKAIWRTILMRRHGWPDIPDERWHDTMAVCGYKALPLKLEGAGKVLRLGIQKDMAAKRVLLQLCKPRKDGTFDEDPAKHQIVRDYNRTDVLSELQLHRRIKSLSKHEREVWLLDQRINQRGVRLDRELINQCQKIVAEAKAPALTEFADLTGGLAPGQRDKLMAWLQSEGVVVSDLKKETVAELLGDDEDADDSTDPETEAAKADALALPARVERALRLRKILGSASIKKLGAMRSCLCEDGKARGLIQYHGAGPGRWAGRLLQPHNFPRPTLKEVIGFKPNGEEIHGGHDPEQLVAALMTGDQEWVRCMFGEPIEAVANGLRHVLVASENNAFVVGDYKSIECVIVMALAGQHDKCEAFERGESLYIPMAEAIFHRKIDKVADLREYTIGKHTILGCGFQMAGPTFQTKYAKKETIEFCNEVVRVYRKEQCPKVPYVWYGLEDAAAQTVWTGRPHSAYGVTYALEDEWLTARLPSGRKIWYYGPQKERNQAPWDPKELKPGFSYWAQKKGHWMRIHAYGGLLAENAVQGLARDLLVDGMFKCEQENMPVVLTVHDELVCDLPSGRADDKLLKQIMRDKPVWARGIGIPVDADCWTGERYRK
jgi:DNA polymerase